MVITVVITTASSKNNGLRLCTVALLIISSGYVNEDQDVT